MAPLAVDDEALALDEIKAVGPGGNHLARPYTRKHFRQIWQSDLFDTTRHDAWEADGSRTLLDRLKARVAELRSEPRAFELPDDVKAGLDRILAERRAGPGLSLGRGRKKPRVRPKPLHRRRMGGILPRARAVLDWPVPAASISISTINRSCGL